MTNSSKSTDTRPVELPTRDPEQRGSIYLPDSSLWLTSTTKPKSWATDWDYDLALYLAKLGTEAVTHGELRGMWGTAEVQGNDPHHVHWLVLHPDISKDTKRAIENLHALGVGLRSAGGSDQDPEPGLFYSPDMSRAYFNYTTPQEIGHLKCVELTGLKDGQGLMRTIFYEQKIFWDKTSAVPSMRRIGADERE